MVVARAAIATARERVRKIAWSAAAHRLRCGVGWLQSEQPVLPPMARICAAEGQRPADMPAQGNALGCRRRKRTSPERAAHVVAPFQGWSFSRWFPGRCPGLACLRTVGARSGRERECGRKPPLWHEEALRRSARRKVAGRLLSRGQTRVHPMRPRSESVWVFFHGQNGGGKLRPAPNGAARPRGGPLKRGSGFRPDGRNRTPPKLRPAHRMWIVIPTYSHPTRRGAMDAGATTSARG